MEKITISSHAKERLKERLGLNKKSMIRMANRAMKKGITELECSRRIRHYLQRVSTKHKRITRIYAGFVWVYGEGNLVTVFPLPRELVVEAEKNKKY